MSETTLNPEPQSFSGPREPAQIPKGSTSLRWRLQLWHACILAAVVLLFGTVFYLQLRRATLVEVDAELLSGARVIEGALRTVRRGSLAEEVAALPLDLPGGGLRLRGPGGPPGNRPPPNERENGNARDFDRKLPDRPPPRDLPLPLGPDGELRPLPPYFAIFADNGTLLRTNASSRNLAYPSLDRPLSFRVIDDHREVLLKGPGGSLILVGRDVRPVIARLYESLVQLIACGVSVLCLGLVGGWWLSERAIRPIAEISDTAAQVSARSLSSRVDTQRMDRELQALGETFNSMLERLEGSFRQQTQFTADASHELRTPLAVMLSHCELALSRPRSTDEYVKTLSICRHAAERMQHLVSGLMTLARADAGKLELNRTDADLHSLAAEVMNMLDPLAKQREITLKLEGQSAKCSIDVERMRQVVVNLIQNAIQYTHVGGAVIVLTESREDLARLRVKDSGIGIPPEAIDRLFDRFYRVDESRTRGSEAQHQGTGLGLAICKSIIDAHGGQLQVTSQLGAGSEFEIKLVGRTCQA